MNAYKGVYLSEQQIHRLESRTELPIVDTPVFLNSGEVAVYYCAATLQEVKNRVVGRTGSYGGGTIRIAKGFSIHTGGSSSRPVYGDVATHYDGEMVLTTNRLVFLSEQKGFEVPYHAITAGTAYSDGLSIQSRSHTYTLIFPRRNLLRLHLMQFEQGKFPLQELTHQMIITTMIMMKSIPMILLRLMAWKDMTLNISVPIFFEEMVFLKSA